MKTPLAPNKGAGAPDQVTEDSVEREVARTLYLFFKSNRRALVQGEPWNDESTLIDGRFDLRLLASWLLRANFGRSER